MKLRNPQLPDRQQGFALFIGLVFLLMITLVAVTAMRGTSLELSMATNTANHEEAFEGAESGRMAFVRAIRDHVACSFRWPQGIQMAPSVGGGGCIDPTKCTSGGAGSLGAGLQSDADFPWEIRLKLMNINWNLNKRLAVENPQDPSTYVKRYELQFGASNAGTAAVGTYMTDTVFPEGSATAQVQGYEGPGAGSKGGGTRQIEVTSKGDIANARANVAGHYRLLMRDAAPDTCPTNLAYGS